MRNRIRFFSLAVLAAAVLAAAPAMAQTTGDPAPVLSCSTSNGYSIVTTGLSYVACGTNNASTCTRITYDVSGGTPDHVAAFIRAEAGTPTAPLGGSMTPAAPCAGESVIGVAPGAVCHETIARFNNQQTKGSSFTLQVNGRRKPLTTSVVVRKGNSQGACRIAGFGLLDTNGGDACVSSCGNFSEFQSVTKQEVFKFKGCEVRFTFDTTTGQVTLFELTGNTAGTCNINGPQGGPIGDLDLFASGIDPEVTFGDGWISSGRNSCTTRLVGGRYYSVCQ